ncbi:MAG: glycosyltransferase [Acidobacteria bacterium]|nr:glycosyltransferase [Acidobacteriota bacterium]
MKIRVLEVLATLKRAGAERMAVSLACRLDPRRFETAVVSLFDAFPEGFESVLEEHGVRTWHLGKRPGLDWRIYPRLAGVLRRYRPDVVHTHSYVLRYALPAAWMSGARGMVHTVHNVARGEVDWLGRRIHRVGFWRGVVPVAVAGEVARSFREEYGFDPAAVIPNGIEVGLYSRPRERWRAEQGFHEDDLLAVSVARLDEQKNPLGLIEAFTRALGGDRRWHLLLAGDGSLREAVRRGASDRVHLLGVRSDVPELLSACDLFALASHWEGHPMAVMEAMAAGLPVVATAVGGVPELVADGVTGLLAPPGDTAAFAGALAEAARRRSELGEAGRRRAARFDVEEMAGSYARLFDRVAGGFS